MHHRLRAHARRAIVVLRFRSLPHAWILALPVTMAVAVHVLLLLLLLAMMLAIGIDQPKVVFRVLIKILRGDAITRGGSIARERQILLEHLVSVAANTDIGTVAVECLRTDRHMRFTAVITATLSLHVWTGSHNT